MRIQPSANESHIEAQPAAPKPQAKPAVATEPAATVQFSKAALQAAAGHSKSVLEALERYLQGFNMQNALHPQGARNIV